MITLFYDSTLLPVSHNYGSLERIVYVFGDVKSLVNVFVTSIDEVSHNKRLSKKSCTLGAFVYLVVAPTPKNFRTVGIYFLRIISPIRLKSSTNH